MSSYPPGVTGMEDQIAGPRFERDETREVDECPMLGLFVIGERQHWPTRAHPTPRGRRMWQRRVSARLCTFEGGTVEGETIGWSSGDEFLWLCPSCGTPNQEDLS